MISLANIYRMAFLISLAIRVGTGHCAFGMQFRCVLITATVDQVACIYRRGIIITALLILLPGSIRAVRFPVAVLLFFCVLHNNRVRVKKYV